ncbi:MAG: hypothetical protein KIS79_01350 [Burkholderiales bacterium]|nr:hypothetical protein [Burkholderiales bacterium]
MADQEIPRSSPAKYGPKTSRDDDMLRVHYILVKAFVPAHQPEPFHDHYYQLDELHCSHSGASRRLLKMMVPLNRAWYIRMYQTADRWITTAQACVLIEVPINPARVIGTLRNRIRIAYLEGYAEGYRHASVSEPARADPVDN